MAKKKSAPARETPRSEHELELANYDEAYRKSLAGTLPVLKPTQISADELIKTGSATACRKRADELENLGFSKWPVRLRERARELEHNRRKAKTKGKVIK